MEINVSNLTNKINADWSTVLSNIKGTEATEASALNARGLTMSSVNGEGIVGSVATAQPQLDAPEAADEYAIATLCAKLGTGNVYDLSPAQVETLCKEVKANLTAYAEQLTAKSTASTGDTSSTSDASASTSATSSTSASSTASVMFDIYALMALLVECGQKMRDAARDVRQAENEQVQTSIQNQADAQRTAAMTGLICGIAVCTIQVGLQAYNLSTQGKSFAKQMEAQKDSGVTAARNDLKLAEMQMKPQDAMANYGKVANATPQATRTTVEGTFNDSQVTKLAMNDPALNPQVQQAQPQVQQQVQAQQVNNEPQVQQQVQAQQVSNEPQVQQQVQAQQVNNEPQVQQQAQAQQVNNEPQVQQQVQAQQVNNEPQVQQQVQAQQVNNEPQVQQQAQAQQVEGVNQDANAIAQQNPTATSLQEYIDAKKVELSNFKATCENPMTQEQALHVERLNLEINKAESLKTMTPEERLVLYRDQVKSELNDIRNNPNASAKEIAYAEAYASKELASVSTPEQIKTDLVSAQARFNQATAVMQQDMNYLKGVHMETRSRAFGDMIAAFGNLGQSCVSSITEMMRAEATEMGAEQQESQEMLDQAKDLFNQCQSLIDSVLQLMDGVLQAEVQSMRDAIQA